MARRTRKGPQPSALSQSFESVQPEAAVTLKCQSTTQASAKGSIFVIENDRIPPTDSDKEFGFEPGVLSKLPPAITEKVKAEFVREQTAMFQDARAKTILTYKNHLAELEQNMMVELKGVADSSLDTEIMMLEDEGLRAQIEAAIISGKSAAVALDESYEDRIKGFAEMEDPYFAKMVNELMQHRATMQHHLHPDKTVATYDAVPQGSIIVANEGIPLAAVVGLIDVKTGKPKVSAIVTTKGSLTSHAAIIARSLGIPYVRIDEAEAKHLKNGEVCILDGAKGQFLVQPSRATAEAFDARIEAQKAARAALDRKWHAKRTVSTLDGQEIKVFANLGVSIEAPSVRAANPSGVGLLRTEVAQSMSLERINADKWYEIFEHNARACAFKDGRYIEMTVRTLDEAGDKGKHALTDEDRKKQLEREEQIIAAQMLALLRLNRDLSEKGHKNKIKVMIPMIGQVADLEAMQCKFDAIADEHNLPTLKLGTMVEVPSVIDQLDNLDADFFSVGSNDLICSLLGIDRYDKESVKQKYDPVNFTVLTELQKVTAAGEKRGIPTSICGDMASQAKYMAVLAGLGFRKLSSGVDDITRNKEVISRIDTQEARLLVEHLKSMKAETREAREEYLAQWNEKHLGLKPDGTVNLNWQKSDGPAPTSEHP